MRGSDGNDIITNNGTVDRSINGGSGNDVVVNRAGGSVRDIRGGGGADQIDNYGTVRRDISGGSGNDTIVHHDTGVVDDIFGGNGNDVIVNNGHVGDDVNGGDGNDQITNSGTMDDLLAGRGNDTVTNNGTVGGDINSGPGNDVVVHNGTVNDDLLTGSGDDEVTINGHVDDQVNTSRGDDTVILQNGASGNSGGSPNTLRVNGGPGNDELRFDLTVGNPAEEQRLHNEIAAASPNNGSLAFGSQLFQWLNFERLVDMVRLVFAPTEQPEPAEPDPCILNDGVNLAVCRYPNGDVAFLRLRNGEGRLHSYLSAAELGATPPGGVVLDRIDDEGYRLRVSRTTEGDFLIEMYSPGTDTNGEFLEQTSPDVQPVVAYRLPL